MCPGLLLAALLWVCEGQVPQVQFVSGCVDFTPITRGCPTSGGMRLTIQGVNIVDAANATVGGVPCPNPITQGDVVTCDLPPKPPGGLVHQVMIQVGEYESVETSVTVGYEDRPLVTSITGCVVDTVGNAVDCPRRGGRLITVRGVNFGSAGSTVTVGGRVCTSPVHTLSGVQLTCTLPPGDGVVPVVVTLVDGLYSPANRNVSYAEETPSETPSMTETDMDPITMSETASDLSTETDSITLVPEGQVAFVEVIASPNVFNLSHTTVLDLTVRARFIGLRISNKAQIAFTPDDPLERPLYFYLKFCEFNETSDNTAMWSCPGYPVGPHIISGTIFTLTWADFRTYPEMGILRPPRSELPPTTITIFSELSELPPEDLSNSTVFEGYSHYWSFLVGGERGVLYFLDNENENTTWRRIESPVEEEDMRGVTSLCFYDKYLVAAVGGRNYRTGEWGDGYAMIGNTVNFSLTWEDQGGHALTSVACKGLGSVVPYLTVGLDNTILYCPDIDGREWHNSTFPKFIKPNIDYLSVQCTSDETCFAMGRTEVGLYWETHILRTNNGGMNWAKWSSIINERGMSMTCVLGTSTCYLATEIYTGSIIHKSDDWAETWRRVSRWDVLSEVKIFCYWADECIAGAGSWLGRWWFPAEIRITKDGGATWPTLHTGEIGEFVGDCKCGGRNNELCICTFNTGLLMYDTNTEGWRNITFRHMLGPMAEFQSYFAADILRDFYEATRGRNWLRNQGWLTGNPCTDSWYGVECDGIDGAAGDVTTLRLSANGLNGTLVASLGLLTRLQHLQLDVNQLRGFIPASFGRMTILKNLMLFNNNLTGTLTNKVVFMTKLEKVALFNNRMWGSLPDVHTLTNLTEFCINNNKFNDQIPGGIGHLEHLKWLNLRNNEFSGTLPPEFGSLGESLQALDMSRNFLVGTVPREWASLYKLTLFDLTNNRERSMQSALCNVFLQYGGERARYYWDASDRCPA